MNSAAASAASLGVWAVFGPGYAVFPLLLGAPLAAVAVVRERLAARARYEASERRAMVSALSVAYAQVRHGNRPLRASLAAAAGSIDGRAAPASRRALEDVVLRMGLGEDLDAAVSAVRADGWRDFLAPLYELGRDYGSGVEPAVSLKAVIDSDEAGRAGAAERAASGAQRRATVGMAIGTIAPSFLVFAFVGYSIVYYSGSGYLLFSMALLVGVPWAQGMVRAGMADAYGS